jgi:biopolymer transport protein ExbD
MGMKLGAGGGGGKNAAFDENSEINVTPFVDVMLVLLIIFMVAAPLASVNVKVDLPRSNANPEGAPNKPVFLSLQPNGAVYIGDNRIGSIDELGAKLEKEIPVEARDTARIYLRGDSSTQYRKVLELMNRLRDAGFYKIALVGEELVK